MTSLRINLQSKIKLIIENDGLRGQRISLRFRPRRKAKQINFTITRYMPIKGKEGVS